MGFIVANPRGDIVDANSVFLDVLGYERSDLLAGRLSLAKLTPSGLGRELRNAGSVPRFEALRPRERPFTRKDGSRVVLIAGVTAIHDTQTIIYIFGEEMRNRYAAGLDISDAGLRRLSDANVMGILISNNLGAILQANDAFLEMIGYTRADLENGAIDWRRLTPQEWLHLDERAIAEMAATGTFSPYEKEYLRKDGTRVPISLGGARLAGTQDEQICYIVDLSAVRRAQAAFRRSESRFKRLTDANVIGVMTSRLSDNTITEANDEFLRIIGFTREEFRDSSISWTEMTPQEFQKSGEEARAELLASGRFTPYEKEYYRKDGSRAPVLIGGALLEESNDEIISYVLDLSEQRKSTQLIQESERRYRILAEALPQIVMLADEQRRIIYVNRHYEDYTGIKLADVATKYFDVIHPDDLEAVKNARATGLPYEIEYRLRRASDGRYRWHFARVMKVSSDSDREHWLAAAMDIDDRKRAEDSLRFIEKAASLLSQSLDLHTTFERLLDLLVPEVGDWAAVSLRTEHGRIQTVAARHKDPAKAHLSDAICGVELYRDSYTGGTPAVYRTGLPQLRSEVGADDVASAINEPYVAAFQALGYGSLIALPLFSGRDVIGSFAVISAGERRQYSAADLPALEELARRASFAIANARSYEREHRVASLLQEAALPRSLPRIEGFSFDAYYQAGRQEAAIGGDWFDAIVPSYGQLIISVGDVAGNGLHAAVLMGNVRQVLRAAAHVHTDPTMMLEVADRTLRGEHENTMVTAFVGVIDLATKILTYASAGHVPALLRTPDRQLIELRAPGLPLGCRHLAPGETRVAQLALGSHLLLYTDGLVEWGRDYLLGEAVLRNYFTRADLSAVHDTAKTLVEEVLPATGSRDDVAALIVGVHN